MPKRTLFTNITPLPPSISRELAIAMVHNHHEMIELNPLVIEHHLIKTPRDAPADEFLDCVWYEMTDKISYLPGGLAKGKVSYKGCFHDLPAGLQTHIYAPLGLDIREKWSIGGSLPGEPPEPRELGLDLPPQGLYIREDGDMRCNIMMSGFVRKNLDHAHKVLVERILKKAERIEQHQATVRNSHMPQSPGIPPSTPGVQAGSYLATSSFIQSPAQSSFPGRPFSAHQNGQENIHPALRRDGGSSQSQPSLPSYQGDQQQQGYYANDLAKQRPPQPPPKQFVAELPGSTYHTSQSAPSRSPLLGVNNNRVSVATELSASEIPMSMPSPNLSSERTSVVSDNPPGPYKYNPQDYAQPGQGSQYGGDYGNRLSELPSAGQNISLYQQQQQQQQQYRQM